MIYYVSPMTLNKTMKEISSAIKFTIKSFLLLPIGFTFLFLLIPFYYITFILRLKVFNEEISVFCLSVANSISDFYFKHEIDEYANAATVNENSLDEKIEEYYSSGKGNSNNKKTNKNNKNNNNKNLDKNNTNTKILNNNVKNKDNLNKNIKNNSKHKDKTAKTNHLIPKHKQKNRSDECMKP